MQEFWCSFITVQSNRRLWQSTGNLNEDRGYTVLKPLCGKTTLYPYGYFKKRREETFCLQIFSLSEILYDVSKQNEQGEE